MVYGHGDVVTCVARSETSLFADCYVATGGQDCTVALWHWNGQVRLMYFKYESLNEVILFRQGSLPENIICPEKHRHLEPSSPDTTHG